MMAYRELWVGAQLLIQPIFVLYTYKYLRLFILLLQNNWDFSQYKGCFPTFKKLFLKNNL